MGKHQPRPPYKLKPQPPKTCPACGGAIVPEVCPFCEGTGCMECGYQPQCTCPRKGKR